MAQIRIDSERYYKIPNVDNMRPFFMSIVSDSNHWMFIGSNGGLSAGRKDAESALFPYYTDDKIIASAEDTGSKSIFVVKKDDKTHVWEPFSIRYACLYRVSRNLYKSVHGNKILFEEVNHDLNLAFQYQWNSSHSYGFVKKCRLINGMEDETKVSVLDGLQNVMPCGVGSALQNQSSNLVDAYKRSELEPGSGLGIFALSAIIVDKAEPSEALNANITWSYGLENPKYLLSGLQLDNFRAGLPVHQENDIKAEKGAYFVVADITLLPGTGKAWSIVANVDQNVSAIVSLSNAILHDPLLPSRVEEDIDKGTERLVALVAASDGLQLTQDNAQDTRHFSNTLFNIMRGGIFDHNYRVEKHDMADYLLNANPSVAQSCQSTLLQLPDQFPLSELKALISSPGDPDFRRLCLEYLPLKFSRRHGDPSRPWNRFSINTHDENDGSKVLYYEGNWRDIFQNWEALAHAYPQFAEGMIHKFLNASTFDGYNPYRITKNGIDWETIEPDDPWSYIGYWGDHQVIYLLKLLEFAEQHKPGQLASYFDQDLFVYTNVPYRIKPYDDILKNPKDTITFDTALDSEIKTQRVSLGADSALLHDHQGQVLRVNFIEKVLAMVLAKMSNFIPGGGIWMNTQRPEWNDANNALVGNGTSVVTLCYLRRFLAFFHGLLQNSTQETVNVSEELVTFFRRVWDTLQEHQHLLEDAINDQDRKTILDGLGRPGSDYRWTVYQQSFSGTKQPIALDELGSFVTLCRRYLEHTLKASERHDGLYHAYNLMTLQNDTAISIAYLDEMLEGQVAVLSSGYLSPAQALKLLDSLKRSALFREDQYSYLLYPAKELPGFMQRNIIPATSVAQSVLLTKLVEDGNTEVIQRDSQGVCHFNGHFKNANDLQEALQRLARGPYADLAISSHQQVLQIFEEVFNHKAFTGRSGTFYGYEGLGSIYWHMVSKLLLAVQECCLKAIESQENETLIGKLLEHYHEINQGIGVHKSPTLYGAFPTDPYSHTPAGKGAQQPGMTGQVKEDILCRFGELGVFVRAGQLCFNPCMLRKEEFLSGPQVFHYVDVHAQRQHVKIDEGSLCFTYCQVPVVYKLAMENRLEVLYQDGTALAFEGLSLPAPVSRQVFQRTGDVLQIIGHVKETILR